MIGDHLQKYTFEYFKQESLNMVPDEIDKRTGSIVYDALMPANYHLADMSMELRNAYLNTNPYTAIEEYLDALVITRNIVRYNATKSVKKATFEFEENTSNLIPIGARFSTINTDNLNYKVIDVFKDTDGNIIPNTYLLECEIEGTIGNGYIGDLLPITHINNLTTAKLTSLITPARDDEDDESLRRRYFESFNEERSAGNVADYRYQITQIEGVGAVQVYPTWLGGGTVKCSIIDPEYNTISDEFINIIENIIDPENAQGEKGKGLGKAPIGHVVTIVTPTKLTLNISANLELESGYSLEVVKNNIVSEISKYIDSVKTSWGVGDELNNYSLSVYISRISSSMLNVEGVNNVTNVLINNNSSDIKLTQNSEIQQIPVLGDVVLNG